MTRLVLISAVVLISGTAREHPARTMSPPPEQASGCGAIADTAPISMIGAFSNIRATEDHAYGFTLRLWRAGDCVFGLLTSTLGLQADMPIGALQDVTFDARSGRLSFSAKLTMGVTSVKGSKDYVPTRDVYEFDGRLTGGTVAGVMSHTVQNHPNVPPERADVVLPTDKTSSLPAARTYGEWRRQWDPILKLRGPKWTIDPK